MSGVPYKANVCPCCMVFSPTDSVCRARSVSLRLPRPGHALLRFYQSRDDLFWDPAHWPDERSRACSFTDILFNQTLSWKDVVRRSGICTPSLFKTDLSSGLNPSITYAKRYPGMYWKAPTASISSDHERMRTLTGIPPLRSCWWLMDVRFMGFFLFLCRNQTPSLKKLEEIPLNWQLFFFTCRHEGIHDVSRPARSVQIGSLHPEGLRQCTCKQTPRYSGNVAKHLCICWTVTVVVVQLLHLIINVRYVCPCRESFCTASLPQALMQKTSSHSIRGSWLKTLKALTSLQLQTNPKSRGLKMWLIRTSSIR